MRLEERIKEERFSFKIFKSSEGNQKTIQDLMNFCD
jgi:hypothetical protein